MKGTRPIALLLVLAAGTAAPSPEAPAKADPAGAGRLQAQEFAQAGVSVRFELEAASGPKEAGSALREGEEALVRFRVTDASGAPLTGLRPAAWMDLRTSATAPDAPQCRGKIQSFLQSSLAARATVDLNTYYVLALNDEPSISVLDPLRGFSTSKLLTLVALPSPGEDWALSRDGRRLFVSLPGASSVAVVGTATWKVVATLEAGPRPARIALQPDERYLWVGSQGAEASVSALDALELKPAGRVATGAGPHDFAFTPDDRYAFVANREAGTVSVVDVRTLAKVQDVPTGPRPVAVAFSSLAHAVYVAHEGGAVVAIDAATHEVVARMEAGPGLVALAFAGEGRWGFAVNRKDGVVRILDATTNAVRHSVPVEPEPDQVAFAGAFAYVRARGSDQVSMISLQGLGTKEGPSVNEFPAGQATPAASGRVATAAAIVPAPEPRAVLVANPSDGLIYYYMEGMAAPMGSFSNYRRTPKAVLAVDRSLRETAPGVFSVGLELPRSGTFDVAFLLDSPRLVHCFEASVAADPARARREGPPVRIEALAAESRLALGSPLRLRFKVTDAQTGQPRSGLKDLRVLGVLAPGHWQDRRWATPLEDGLYEVSLTPPGAGAYYVYWECASQRVRYQDSFPLIVHVSKEDSAHAGKP